MSGKFLPYKYYGAEQGMPEYGFKETTELDRARRRGLRVGASRYGICASRGRRLPRALARSVLMKSDIEVAREYRLAPIEEIAAKLDIPETALHPYGRVMAKIDADYLASLKGRREGKLILVTAINPTPAGEGKTTTTIGLGDGLDPDRQARRDLSARALARALLRHEGRRDRRRARAGRADGRDQPAFHRRFSRHHRAHNLLAAMLDNHIHWGNALDIDTRRVAWRRALDMNDRALRDIVVGLGGPANGFVREDGFDITVASEVMAAFCLSETIEELEAAARAHGRRLHARKEAGDREAT